MPQYRERVIRDPLYGYITIPRRLEWFVDHLVVQRLRGISQTSMASVVYPSMTGSRFEHSLGTMHLARLAWEAVWRNASSSTDSPEENLQLQFLEYIRSDPEIRDLSADVSAKQFGEILGDAVAAVGLLHDVGHTPFSHALEPFFKEHWDEISSGTPNVQFTSLESKYGVNRQAHELFGCVLADDLISERLAYGSLGADEKLFLIIVREVSLLKRTKKDWAKELHGIVDGEIDVDRLDYLMRDAQRAGAEFGAIDYQRLVDTVEIHQSGETGAWLLGFGVRAQSAIETLLVQRLQTYRWILFHHRVVACDLFALRGLQMLWELQKSDTPIQVVPSGSRGNGQPQKICLRELFLPLQPRLNYLHASDPELGFGREVEDAPALREMATEDRNAWIRQLQVFDQVGLDDAAVVEWLRRGAILAEYLLLKGLNLGDDQARARRLVTYYSAAMLRRKVMTIAWKRFTDYQSEAELYSVEFGRQLFGKGELADYETVFDWLAREVPHASERVKNLKAYVEKLRNRDPQCVTLLHHIAYYAVGANGFNISADLTARAGVIGGAGSGMFWEVTFRSFNAIKEGLSATQVYCGSERKSLRSFSSLADSLAMAEDQRIKLFAYLVVYHNNDLDSNSSGSDTDLTRRVRDKLRVFLPGLLVEHYKEDMRKRFKKSTWFPEEEKWVE